jgi:hypothetical protein
MEQRPVALARKLLAVLEENWDEPWLQSMLRDLGEPPVPKELLPGVVGEMALIVKLRQ